MRVLKWMQPNLGHHKWLLIARGALSQGLKLPKSEIDVEVEGKQGRTLKTS